LETFLQYQSTATLPWESDLRILVGEFYQNIVTYEDKWCCGWLLGRGKAGFATDYTDERKSALAEGCNHFQG
jgi:hypothetical protein